MLPDGDVLLSEIAEQIKYASPEICPNNTYNKTYEMGEIIKEGSIYDIPICEICEGLTKAQYKRLARKQREYIEALTLKKQ